MFYHKIDNKTDIRIQWQNYSEIRAIICKKITFFFFFCGQKLKVVLEDFETARKKKNLDHAQGT